MKYNYGDVFENRKSLLRCTVKSIFKELENGTFIYACLSEHKSVRGKQKTIYLPEESVERYYHVFLEDENEEE